MSRSAMYLTQPLHRMLRHWPEAIATIDGARVQNWTGFADRITRYAGALHSLGMAQGDRVGFLGRNADHTMEFLFGVWWAGGVVNPVNIRWSAAEIAYSLENCGTRILLIDDSFLPMLDDIRAQAPGLAHVACIGSGRAGVASLETLISAAEKPADALRQGDDLAAILYTGGTTGAPKGVMLTHRSLLTSSLSLAGAEECGPGPCVLHSAPLFHIAGIMLMLAGLLRGAVNVFVPGFEPQAVLTAIEAHRITDLFMVPTMLQAMLDHRAFGEHDVGSLRHIYYGASPIAPALMDRAIAALPGVGFVQAYGMTELSPIATILPPSDHGPEGRASGRARSAGRATMVTEVRIIDAEDREVPRGEIGEIAVRGEVMMTGYWNMPEATETALRGGWMHTGDLGRMDDEGYVFLVDRLKDMIITGGENVYSAEVEAALASHPSVSQSAVIGMPDSYWGETVHAVLVLRQGHELDETALFHHCRERIAGYKCPRSFEVVSALPLSGAGKVLKSALRAERFKG